MSNDEAEEEEDYVTLNETQTFAIFDCILDTIIQPLLMMRVMGLTRDEMERMCTKAINKATSGNIEELIQ